MSTFTTTTNTHKPLLVLASGGYILKQLLRFGFWHAIVENPWVVGWGKFSRKISVNSRDMYKMRLDVIGIWERVSHQK